jgi:predicted alpha/beta superfamily hydrolase
MNRKLFCKSLLGLAVALAVLLLSPPKTHGQAPDATARLYLKSDVLKEERVVLVSTPPGYERGGERYPVLYLTDGDAQIGHTISTISFLARNGRMPEMIVVGILNTDRTRDLTPTNASLAIPGGRVQPFPTSGGADKFLKFIETELIPRIESDYRVHPYRIFAGHSLGGLFAIHAMLARPELFNAYIAVSPSLFWDNDFELKRAEEFFKTHKEWKKTLYFSLGNEPGDITASFNRFNEILKQYQPKNFDYLSQQFMEEDHGSVVLRSHYAGLRKIFEDWQLPTNAATGAIEGGWASVEEHYKHLSQEFGYAIAPSEGQVNRLGYQLIGEGKLDEAIQVFKANVARHPNSPNVYDSLGEAYENSGRPDFARNNYEKAYILGKERNDPNTQIFKANFDRLTGKSKEEADTKK